MIYIKYLVKQGYHNYLPTSPIELDKEINILNRASIRINNYITLKVFLVDKLTNFNIMLYKYNFTYLKASLNYIKSFFLINKFSYKVANMRHQLQKFNTSKLEEELLCNLIDNIKI